MAYSAFTLARCEAELGITVQTGVNLFGHIPPAPFDPATAARLVQFRGLALAINTEKARSEMLIAPLLADAWRVGAGRVSLLSGATFDVDPGAELNGVCDFIFGHPPQLDTVTRPVLMITEAKNESVMSGLGQCAASMVAAQRFNQNRQPAVPTIHGCVTNGESWRFLRLTGTALEIDIADYLIGEPDRILGLILHFLGIAPAAAPAAA